MTPRAGSLKTTRAKIDKLDAKLVALLNQRALLAQQIGNFKKHQKLAIYSPRREQEVLQRVSAINQGPLSERSLHGIFREIMSGSLELEHGLTICYLGPTGTFTEQAAKSKFGGAVDYLPADSIEAVFREVALEQTDYGVVPVENSTGGGITETMDVFMHYQLKVCAEILMRIHHHFMRKNHSGPVKRIYSIGPVFVQCRQWLAAHYPQADRIDMGSTTMAVQKAAGDPQSAAIASKAAAQRYRLKVLADCVEDRADNITRFLVIGHHADQATGDDKTSIMLSLKNEVGALWKLLSHFKKHGLNLSRIESRPSPLEAWDYVFFIDFAGHIDDANVQATLASVQNHVKFLQVLGSYPRCLTIMS